MAEGDSNYQVGYGKPPKQNQFAKGRSGNPSGRRKGAKNMSTLLTEACQEKVTVNRNGRKVKMTKMSASLHQLANKAATGDLKAIRELMYWFKVLNEAMQDLPSSSFYDENDSVVVTSILKRLRQCETAREDLGAGDKAETPDE